MDTQRLALQKAAEFKRPRPISNEPENNQSSALGFSAAAKMLEELKRAYTQILHEREEQIIQLKEEVTDLKTLVKVLEFENEKYRK